MGVSEDTEIETSTLSVFRRVIDFIILVHRRSSLTLQEIRESGLLSFVSQIVRDENARLPLVLIEWLLLLLGEIAKVSVGLG